MRLRNLKIGQRLGGGFAGILLLMISITGIGAFQLFQSKIRIDSIVNERIPTTVLVNTIKSDLSDLIGNMRSILLSNDVENSGTELQLVEQDNQFIEENIAKLEKMMSGSEEGRRHVEDLKSRRVLFNQASDRFLKSVKENQLDEAKTRFLSEIRSFADGYTREVDSLIDYEGKLAEAAGQEANLAIQQALLIMIVLAGIASVIGIVVAILVTRGIIKPLNEAVAVAELVASGDLRSTIKVESKDEIGKLMLALRNMNEGLVRIVSEVRGRTDTIASASVEIAAGTTQLSSRTEHQADSLSETAASVGDLKNTVHQNANSTEQANQLVASSTLAAVKGGEVVAGVINTMALIKVSSTRIGDIISVIDGIAFQTNILALNAAVEAARAGEQGRGFAVVAAEVRNLAQRSAEAAKEVKILVSDSMQKVDAGNLLVDNAGQTMDEIVSSVKKVAEIMTKIASAGREQSTGIESLAHAIGDMDDMTQQNAALVEQATAATESMKEQAGWLTSAVSIFKLDGVQSISRESSAIAPNLMAAEVPRAVLRVNSR